MTFFFSPWFPISETVSVFVYQIITPLPPRELIKVTGTTPPRSTPPHSSAWITRGSEKKKGEWNHHRSVRGYKIPWESRRAPQVPLFPRGGHSPVVCAPEHVGVWCVKGSLARQMSSVRQRAAGTILGLGGDP